MSELATELAAAGGAEAPPRTTARLRQLLLASLSEGRAELGRTRSGSKDRPVTVAMAAGDGRLLAVTPADAGLRADPEAAGEREWLLVAASVAALVDLACPPSPATAADLALEAGEHQGFLLLAYPAELEPDEL